MAFWNRISDARLEELIRASDKGEEWAQDEYGRIFDEYDMDPDFIRRVCKARVKIYKADAERGDKNAILRYAHALAKLGRKKEAFDWYISLTSKGDTDAMLALSEQYNEYGSFGHNPDEEMRWLHLSADRGNAEAQCKMGLECMCVGNRHEGLLWYEKSAKQGFPHGQIGYADCLRDQLSALFEYSHGMEEIIPGRYDYIRRIYGDLPKSECKSVMRELFWKTEDLYLKGMSNCTSESYLSSAFTGLTMLYLYPNGVCEPMYYLAAYYQYEGYRVLDNKADYDFCLKIIRDNNLRVTDRDLKEWGEIGVFDWAEKKGIDLSPKETTEGTPVREAPKGSGNATGSTAGSTGRNSTAVNSGRGGEKRSDLTEESMVSYLLTRFNSEYGINLNSEPMAMQRIRKAVSENIGRVRRGETVQINLPYITANFSGPLHMDIYVSPKDFSAQSPKAEAVGADIKTEHFITPQQARNGCSTDVAVKECGKHYTVTIPAGISDGEVLRLSGAGKADPVTGKKGNVFVKIRIKNEPQAARQTVSHSRCTLRLTLENSEHIVGFADGTLYSFVIDTEAVMLVAESRDVTVMREIAPGKHAVRVDVYNSKGDVGKKSPICSSRKKDFVAEAGKTVDISVARGGMFADPKVKITYGNK